ncbi:hypothetical protein COT97_01405 [Candidatus Falkowbacteria bacterium CG10_big_fil_rev_8_21_14_0_10_39_11]|uniref:Uncharacterized protein n=1 Tax=Candidatus Falkowbacteria bacterium CG10_big_fil_rev_8_21_14_0_10_39_11 TaxID=1974565 RepID=A0A2H0V5T0_9BACT|nr:MAG: hypothetical protein COT97_01405 [Candidatus Falkowbacteria bacterium CG10_big_fil_rev_8_21_14_0_10_39_11]
MNCPECQAKDSLRVHVLVSDGFGRPLVCVNCWTWFNAPEPGRVYTDFWEPKEDNLVVDDWNWRARQGSALTAKMKTALVAMPTPEAYIATRTKVKQP